MLEKIRERTPRFLKEIYRSVVILFRYPFADRRAKPDFIIIGVQKGGTSTLFEYLKQHPDIKTAVFKEVHYYDHHYHKGIKWYKSFFPVAKKNKSVLYGEASPYYFFHPLVPERLYNDSPNIKLILLLRDPIDRAYSHYQMERRKGREKLKSFEEAISKEAERIEMGYNAIINGEKFYNYNHHVYSYLSRGCYDEQVKRWLRYFKKEQLLVIKSEDFFASPYENLERIYQFLEVPVIFPKNLQIKNQGSYNPVDQNTLNRLQDYYRSHNKVLSQILGENFQWS
jgi:hypothetical protein